MQPRSVLGIDVFDPVFLLSGFRLEPRGHEEVAGREAVTVAVATTPTCEAGPFDHHDLLHEIAVDAEWGVLLRGVWRYGEAEAQGFVFREIRFESHQSSR